MQGARRLYTKDEHDALIREVRMKHLKAMLGLNLFIKSLTNHFDKKDNMRKRQFNKYVKEHLKQ